MSKFELRLSIAAIIFVLVYLAAAGLTIHSRMARVERPARIEATGPPPGHSEMMMVELLLPMLIVLTVAGCFVAVRRRRARALEAMDEDTEPDEEPPALHSSE